MENDAIQPTVTLDKKLHDLVGPFLESNSIKDAIIIAKDPDTNNLALYYRGHFYDIACIVAATNKKFRQQIEKELL